MSFNITNKSDAPKPSRLLITPGKRQATPSEKGLSEKKSKIESLGNELLDPSKREMPSSSSSNELKNRKTKKMAMPTLPESKKPKGPGFIFSAVPQGNGAFIYHNGSKYEGEKEFLLGLMEENIKVDGKMEKWKDREFVFCLMGVNMLENGKTENYMVREFLLPQMESGNLLDMRME